MYSYTIYTTSTSSTLNYIYEFTILLLQDEHTTTMSSNIIVLVSSTTF